MKKRMKKWKRKRKRKRKEWCRKKENGIKEKKKCNSASSSIMGRVAEVFPLCLDYEKREGYMNIVCRRKRHHITKIKTRKDLEITCSRLRSDRWNWGRCLSLTTVGFARWKGIWRLPWQWRPRFGHSRPPNRTGPSRRGRSTLKD